MLHHPAPHMPFHENTKLGERFKDQTWPVPASFDDIAKNKPDSPRPFSITIPEGLMAFQGRPNVWGDRAWKMPVGLSAKHQKEWAYQRLMRAYCACIASLDENVGHVMDYLKESGLEEDTIVLYSSDQGFFLGEHGWYDKRFMYEESIRMPLIVRMPKRPAPTLDRERQAVSSAMVLNVDYAPTLLDLAGLDIPSHMQGHSFAAELQGIPSQNRRKSMYYHFYEDRKDSPLPVKRHYGVRTERYKLICFYTVGQWELYDLSKDPHELENVYENNKYSDVRNNLVIELKKLRHELGDQTGPAVKDKSRDPRQSSPQF
jgi:arylsulfatase A-like enzyme